MEQHHFFAFLDRMKYIGRWGLMRSTTPENVQEHSMQVAVLTHALAVIGRDLYGSTVDPAALALAALYHDCAEILTGDMPTPVKYKNAALSGAYKDAERDAKQQLFAMLPPALRDGYAPVLFFEETHPDQYLYIKAADKLSGYIKCVQELSAGNRDFKKAADALHGTLVQLQAQLPALSYFMTHCLDAYSLTLDEL